MTAFNSSCERRPFEYFVVLNGYMLISDGNAVLNKEMPPNLAVTQRIDIVASFIPEQKEMRYLSLCNCAEVWPARAKNICNLPGSNKRPLDA